MVTLKEMAELLEQVAAIDNRKVTPDHVQAWHDVCGHVGLTVAKRALILARRDATVQYLEPRHLMAKVAVAAAELSDEARRAEQSNEVEGRRDPVPICAAHDVKITECKPCVQVLMAQHGRLYGTHLHDWAVKQGLYRKDSLV